MITEFNKGDLVELIDTSDQNSKIGTEMWLPPCNTLAVVLKSEFGYINVKWFTNDKIKIYGCTGWNAKRFKFISRVPNITSITDI